MIGTFVKGFRELSAKGVIGLNARNFHYLMRYNERFRFPLVDNKLLTKKKSLEIGLPVPRLLGEIRFQREIRTLRKLIEGEEGFVLKPAHGSGGKGILIIQQDQQGRFLRTNGNPVSLRAIERHLANSLNGLHSLGGVWDHVLVEEKIKPSSHFRDFSYQGIPDVRIILFHGYPVMAMLRVATKKSKGRANLHQGAIGIGLRLFDGSPIQAFWGTKIITKHPDTLAVFSDIRMPHWERVLEIACQSYDSVKLGYMGVDIVFDEQKGPLILEWNARPGLAIQLANGIGLKSRLEWVKVFRDESHTPKDRLNLAVSQWEET